MAEYTGGGETCLEETERPLLAQEGPTQARKAPNVRLQHPTPGIRAPGWERCSPRVGPPRARICGRRPAKGEAGRGQEAEDGVETLAPAAAWLHLLQRRSEPGRPGSARRRPLLPAPFCEAPPRRRGAGPDSAARRALSPGGESRARRLRRRPLKGEV